MATSQTESKFNETESVKRLNPNCKDCKNHVEYEFFTEQKTSWFASICYMGKYSYLVDLKMKECPYFIKSEEQK